MKISPRLILLDVLLGVVLVAGGLKLRRNWYDFEAAHRVEAILAEPEQARAVPAVRGAESLIGDWTDIVGKNPFSFDRNDVAILAPPPPPVAPVQAPAPPAAPKPILFGTLGIGQDWTASLASGQGTAVSRKTKAMKVGETIDGWQLVEIHEKTVVVALGGARETLSIDTGVVPRDSTRTLAAAPTQPIVLQTQSNAASEKTSGSGAATGAATNESQPPPPPGANKGHWIITPFGRTWSEDK